MSERFTSLVAVATLVIGLAGASCVPSGQGGEEAPWGAEAVEFFDAIAAGLSDADKYATARFFEVGGALDLRAWGRDIAVGRHSIAEVLGSTLYLDPRATGAAEELADLDVDVEQVFLGADQAVVRYDAHTHAGIPWMELYALGRNAVVSSRLYTEDLGHVAPQDRFDRVPAHEFYDRYLEVWSSGDPDRLDEVYARSAVSRWALTGEQRVGLAELGELMRVAPPIAAGPWPELFGFDVPPRHEKVAVVQIEGDCPMLEARRWVFEGGMIVDETRFPHVDSVRRCHGALDGGWWDGFEPSPDTAGTIRTVDVAGQRIELVNASTDHVEFAMWLFDRFRVGSLAWPDVEAIWFPPSIDCDISEGVAKRTDERADGGSTVTLCFTPEEINSGWADVDWSARASHQGLHELAHVWMYTELDDSTRWAFVESVGLEVWRDPDVFWPDRGVEAAAETIAWALAGNQAEYAIEPVPECSVLAARYEMLTGRAPLTSCSERGAP